MRLELSIFDSHRNLTLKLYNAYKDIYGSEDCEGIIESLQAYHIQFISWEASILGNLNHLEEAYQVMNNLIPFS